jgi:uncharacterized protein YbjT (DUF2867 family)
MCVLLRALGFNFFLGCTVWFIRAVYAQPSMMSITNTQTSPTSPPRPTRVLLLGAQGFIGSYVLRQLLADGLHVLAVCRNQPAEPTAHGVSWCALNLQTMRRSSNWLPHLEQVDVVINCVGILRQRWGETYEAIHHEMPAALALACAQTGARLIHTSALGLHEGAKSRFLSSKLRGEQAICRSGCDYSIVRPSLIDGLGGFGASWLRMLASWPVHFVPVGATGKIAAVQAQDLALAYASLASQTRLADWRDANLGGTRLLTYANYLQLLRGVESGHAKPALQIPLPNWMSRLGAHLCDVFRFSPFSYGHWILLQRDNMPVPNALPALLGRAPTAITYSRVALKDDFRLS